MMFKFVLFFTTLLGVAAKFLSKSHVELDGAVVAAQLRCDGFLCPKWALDITRYDIVRQVGVQFEYQLLELLPLAPTEQRSNNLWTAYNPNNREYTVAVEDYPNPGMDTFFTATISSDVTSAKAVISNAIIGHPDASVGAPGNMHLRKILYCPEGHHLALFDDGSLHHLDIASGTYKQIANVKTSGLASLTMTNAHVVDGSILKSILYDSVNYVSYLAKTDIESGAVSSAVQIQQIRGSLGNEKPIAAHMTLDPNAKVNKLTLIFAGNFDQITYVDETTGVQTPLTANLADDTNNGIPVEFQCNTATKDCDTLWSTTAYDAKNNALYFQTHEVSDDTSTTYIYNSKYYTSKLSPDAYPVFNPSVTMTFGYSGYQWVSIEN